MSFDFNNDVPIYLQIIEYIKTQIINKTYLPNQKIPSVRDLSLFFEVNPNTIQKSLLELEDMGLIITESTNGKFVTNKQNIIDKIKQNTIKTKLLNFYESMQNIGISKEELLKILSEDIKQK